MAEEGISIEKLYDKTGSMYKLVVLASKRALELNEGAVQLVKTKEKNVSLAALQEIAEGKVVYKKSKADKK